MGNNQSREFELRDQHAEEYDAWYVKDKGKMYPWVEKKVILSMLGIQGDEVILDAGCGTGSFTVDIARKSRKVYAVDFSPKSITVLKRKLESQHIQNVHALVGDITKSLPVPELVDKILSVQVIHSIPSERQRHEALKNLYNRLRTGGLCVVSVYNYNWIVGLRRHQEGKFSNGLYYFRFTPQEVYSLLRKVGFRDVAIRGCINFKWYRHLSHGYVSFLGFPIAQLDLLLSRYGISSFFGNYLVCRAIK